MSHEFLMTRDHFIGYIRETLAPDLRDSGSNATAADLLAACHFIEGAQSVAVDSEGGRARVVSTR